MEHEIQCPEDKIMRYFLWADYFHDSNVTDIEFNRYGRKEHHFPNRIEMTIISIRDIDNDSSVPESYQEARAYISRNQEKYKYMLIFHDCIYISSERLFSCNDFLQGRFLDTALLRDVQKESDAQGKGKKYYHYRIVFDDGYFDVIFSKFKLVKTVGKVKCPDFDLITNYPMWYLVKLRDGEHPNEELPLDILWVRNLLACGGNEERRYALIHLVMNEKLNMIEEARSIMKLDWLEYDEAREAAIWAIGLQGDENDLPTLFDEYFCIRQRYGSVGIAACSTPLPMRHVMDAIEHIKNRYPDEIEKKPEATGPSKTLMGVAYSLGP